MDILWAISNPPNPTPEPPRQPKLQHRSSTSFGSVHYDDILPSPGPSTIGLSGSSLLGAVSSGQFAIPTPPYADGSWEMYQDFVGGVQFWGYALASGSGDGAVRMWDSKSPYIHMRNMSRCSSSVQCALVKPTAHSPVILAQSHAFNLTK